MCGRVETVRALLEAGADPSITDNHGATPADCASENEEILKPLGQYADDNEGPTAD